MLFNSPVITQVFVPTAELVIRTRIPPNEANAEIETQRLKAETKKENFQCI